MHAGTSGWDLPITGTNRTLPTRDDALLQRGRTPRGVTRAYHRHLQSDQASSRQEGVRSGTADEPFASTEATRLDQLRLAVLEDGFNAELALGLHGQLIEELRTLTLEQPYRETFWEQLMLALYRAGRQADTLHAYSEVRTRLSDDLGIEPGPALKDIEQRVLARDPGLALETSPAVSATDARVATPSNLPLQRTTFIGRDRDLAIAGGRAGDGDQTGGR